MEIIERMPVPIYETVCQECKSRYQYKAVEVSYMHTNCPVCGVSNWASLIPVAYDVNDEERKDDASHPFADDVMMGGRADDE